MIVSVLRLHIVLLGPLLILSTSIPSAFTFHPKLAVQKTRALFVYTGANTYVQKYTELKHILVYTKDPPLSVLNQEDNQQSALCNSTKLLLTKVANHQTSLQSIYHRQIPGASVRLKESISSYFEAYTKAHNSTSFTSKSSVCARQGFPYVSETELDPFKRSLSKYSAK